MLLKKHKAKCFITKVNKLILVFVVLIFAACGQQKNESKIKDGNFVVIYNEITVTSAGLTCTDAQLQYQNGSLYKPTEKISDTALSLKLFTTGYTPSNGFVSLNGSLTLKDSLGNIVFANSNYFNNQSISNGDARFINMPFTVNIKNTKSKTLMLQATLTELNTNAKVYAATELKIK
jgi:hypothetical protein